MLNSLSLFFRVSKFMKILKKHTDFFIFLYNLGLFFIGVRSKKLFVVYFEALGWYFLQKCILYFWE